MAEQEELIKASKADYELLQADMLRIQGENDAARKKVDEVLRAFEEEVAINYDQKAQEIELKTKESETLAEDLNKTLVRIQIS